MGQDGILRRVVDPPAEGRMQASTGGLPIRRRFTTCPTMHSPNPVKHPPCAGSWSMDFPRGLEGQEITARIPTFLELTLTLKEDCCSASFTAM